MKDDTMKCVSNGREVERKVDFVENGEYVDTPIYMEVPELESDKEMIIWTWGDTRPHIIKLRD